MDFSVRACRWESGETRTHRHLCGASGWPEGLGGNPPGRCLSTLPVSQLVQPGRWPLAGRTSCPKYITEISLVNASSGLFGSEQYGERETLRSLTFGLERLLRAVAGSGEVSRKMWDWVSVLSSNHREWSMVVTCQPQLQTSDSSPQHGSGCSWPNHAARQGCRVKPLHSPRTDDFLPSTSR